MKNQKGITLIALVITIIVLLILAGVTIAMLTGTDAAPVKANEAKQKQDIGAAKDQVMLYAQEFQTLAYDKIYVRGEGKDSTTQSQSSATKITDVGTLVGNGIKTAKTSGDDSATIKAVFGTDSNVITTSLSKGLSGTEVGLATITTSGSPITNINPGATSNPTTETDATAYIQIKTTDFVTYGHIEHKGGALVWDANIQARTN